MQSKDRAQPFQDIPWTVLDSSDCTTTVHLNRVKAHTKRARGSLSENVRGAQYLSPGSKDKPPGPGRLPRSTPCSMSSQLKI